MSGINQEIKDAEAAVDSLGGIEDLANTASVEVTLDAVASAFARLRRPRSRRAAQTSATSLTEVLTQFVEDGVLDPVVISLCDEITALFEFKDYESYSEEYVSNRLSILLSDLQDELQQALSTLHDQEIE